MAEEILGAHDGVHRHVQLGALQVGAAAHVGQHLLCLLIQAHAGEDLLVFIYLQFNAGVHIQGYHGGHGIGLLIGHAASASHQK